MADFAFMSGAIFGELDLRAQKLLKGIDDSLKAVTNFVAQSTKQVETFQQTFEEKSTRGVQAFVQKATRQFDAFANAFGTAFAEKAPKVMDAFSKAFGASFATTGSKEADAFAKNFEQRTLAGVHAFAEKGAKTVEDFYRSFGVQTQKLPIQIEGLAKNLAPSTMRTFGSLLLKDLETVGTGIGAAFKRIAGGIGSVFVGPLSWLTDKLLNIKSLLLGFAAYEFFAHATEVEKTRTAFDNLTKSIGLASESLLIKLRAAVRGSVSDFDLMQAANAAINYGIVKDADQFAKLAEQSKALGRAMGFDTKSAMELAIDGMGRMTERTLKQLGVMFNAEVAYRKYADAVGKTTEELTDSERRTAYVSGAMEKMSALVANLGPQQALATDGFKQLIIAIENVGEEIALIISGPFGHLASTIAKLISDAQPMLIRFAEMVATMLESVFTQVTRAIDQFVNGEISGPQLFGKLVGVLTRVINATVTLAVKLIVEGIKRGTPIVADAIWNAAKEAIGGGLEGKRQELRGRIKLLEDELKDEGVQKTFLGNPVGVPMSKADADGIRALRDKLLQQLKDLEAPGEKERTAQLVQEWIDSVTPVPQAGNRAAEEWNGLVATISGSIRRGSDSLLSTVDSATAVAGGAIGKLVSIFGGGQLPGTGKQAQDVMDAEGAVTKLINTWEAKITELKKATAGSLNMTEAQRTLAAFDQDVQKRAADIKKIPESWQTSLASKRSNLVDALNLQTSQEALKGLQDQLRAANAEMAAVGATPLAGKMAALDEATEKYRRSLIGLDEDLPSAREAWQQWLDMMARVQAVISETDLKRITVEIEDQARALRVGLENVGLPRLQQQINLIEAERVKATRGLTGESLDRMNALYDEKVWSAREQTIREYEHSVQQTIDETNLQMAKLGKTPLEQQLLEIQEARRKAIQEEGIPVEVADSAAQKRIQQAYHLAAKELDVGLAQDVSQSIGDGIYNGVMQRKDAGQVLADVWGNMFAASFKRSMDQAVGWLQSKLTDVFEDLGKMTGAGAGLGGIATGLIAIGGAIWQNLGSKKEATLDSIQSQINSSEAVRGVVAGPTTVAVAKMGDALKQAMRGTELILMDIRTILAGGGGSAAGVAGTMNSALPLTGSTV